MPVLLILTVGGAPEPIAASLLCREPEPVERAVFICSTDSRASLGLDFEIRPPVQHPLRPTALALAREQGCDLRPGQYEVMTVSNHQDLTRCVEEIRRTLDRQVRNWLSRGPEFLVISDITGGTKCMSVALGLVARRWQCLFRYVGGQERTREGVGIVINGKEQVVYCKNPWDALGFEVAEQAFAIFEAGDFAAAARLLETAKRRTGAPHITRAFAAAEAITAGFAAWDHFDHRLAEPRLRDALKGSHDLAWFLGEERAAAIRRDVEAWLERIPVAMPDPRPSRELLIDLLANARRRRREMRFDDAVARLYRAVELMAQVRLADYGIDTKAVPLDRIPDACGPDFLAAAHDGVVACGLQASYKLLVCLGDELGAAFVRLMPLNHGSLLEMRNNSILAHGFQPVGDVGCDKLWKMALDLARVMGITENQLPEFPKLAAPEPA